MSDKLYGSPLTYALNVLGRIVSIYEVENGIACNCRCPNCNDALIAKKGHGGRQPHFAHTNDMDCPGAVMSALHLLAEQIIVDSKAIMVPEYRGIPPQRLEFENMEFERREDRKDLQPDIVGITADGLRWAIEIHNTNEVDEIKESKIIESNITCLEIDVQGQDLDKDKLKQFLLYSDSKRKWINNPNYDNQIAEKRRGEIELCINNLLPKDEMEKPNIHLPDYFGNECESITIKEMLDVQNSEVGDFARIRVKAIDGMEYLFNIGFKDSLDDNRKLAPMPKDCNELSIYVDGISSETFIIQKDLFIRWEYNYKYEQNKKAELENYRINPDYDIRHIEYCESECEYTSFSCQCIYQKEHIVHEGNKYIVCDKRKKEDDKKEQKKYASVLRYNSPQTIDNRTSLGRYMPNRIAQGKVANIEVSKEDEKRIDDYYSLLLENVNYPFNNKINERIEIYNCKLAMRCCGIIVLFRKDNRDYYLYCISIVNHKLVFIEKGDYKSGDYATNYYKYFVEKWNIKDEVDLDYINPFEGVEDLTDVPF